MSELELTEKVRHFYYCLIIAIKIRKNHTHKPTEKQMRRFLLGWLQRARSEKLFNPLVAREIEWLMKDLTGVSMLGIDARFMRVYSDIGSLLDEARALALTFGEQQKSNAC